MKPEDIILFDMDGTLCDDLALRESMEKLQPPNEPPYIGVHGKILVDDWPPYITRWLEWRPRGLVIMPTQKHNAEYTHPQVIRYDGENIEEVAKALKAWKERENVR